jgi:hypothetical protein
MQFDKDQGDMLYFLRQVFFENDLDQLTVVSLLQ